MDDRKKRINELEQRKKEQIALLDALLIRFGETLIKRMSDSDVSDFEEVAVYREHQVAIADSQASIMAIEEQIRRSKELDEKIESKERETENYAKELTGVYGKLGKLLLSHSTNERYADFCETFREQNEVLLTKVRSLEERLEELEKKEGGNVITWIGKSAQSLVVRSFLTKAQENLQQLRRNVGERYSKQYAVGLPADNDGLTPEITEIDHVCAEIERKRIQAHALSEDLEDLKEERRHINSSYSAEGGPIKYINTLKSHIAGTQNELKTLYRRVGAEAASVGPSANETTEDRRSVLDSVILPQDQEGLDNASRISNTIRDAEKTIEKLQASLAIDEEKVKIEKIRKLIQEKRDKIARAENNIEKYEEEIRDSEAYIAKLQDLS